MQERMDPKPKALQPLQWWCSSMSVLLHLEMALPEQNLLPQKSSMAWQEKWDVEGGLQNLGNTCFINYVLQSPTYSMFLANHLLSYEHRRSFESFLLHILRLLGSSEDGKPTVTLVTTPNFPLQSLQSMLSVVQKTVLVVMCHVPTPREDNFLLPVAPEVHLKILPGILCICHLNVRSFGVWVFFFLERFC